MNFLIIDDHPLVRSSMAVLLSEYLPQVSFTERHSFEDALDVIKEGCPDLILMDLSLPGMGGLEAISSILRIYPDAKILVLSGSTNQADVQRSMDAGAKGYLNKTASSEEMVKQIKAIVFENHHVETPLKTRMGQGNFSSLTEKEMLVLELLTKGLKNRDIAEALDISETDVKERCRKIYKKLGVNNRTQAVYQAVSLRKL